MDLTENPHVDLEPTVLERWGAAGEKESLSCVCSRTGPQSDREVVAV